MSAANPRLQFEEQLQSLRIRLGNQVPTEKWTDLWKAQHDRAFMVAGAAKADLLADLAGAVQGAIAGGQSIEWFRSQFDDIVAKHGWAYTGERNWRTRVIYQTNMATSYAAGRLAQLRDPELRRLKPYWMYNHNDSVLHPRPLHVSWNGLTLPADHPWFKTHYPPNGWGCQCYITAVSESEARRRGGRITDTPPDNGADPDTGTPNGIDRGWDYMPGDTVTGDLNKQIDTKIDKLPAPLGQALKNDIYHIPPAPLAPGAMPAFREATSLREAERFGTELVSTGGGKPYVLMQGDIPLLRYKHGTTTHADIREKKLNRAIYREMTVDTANVVNRTLLDMQRQADRLGLPRLRAINNNAGRAVATMGDGVLAVNAQAANRYMSDTSTPATWRPGEALRDRPYSSMNYFSGADKLRAAMWHEFGHHVHQQYGVTTLREYVAPSVERALRELWRSKQEKVFATSYGAVDAEEWWAESFAVYQMGREDLVDPDILALIQRVERGETV